MEKSTIIILQKRLNELTKYEKLSCDGLIGDKTIKAIEESLNINYSISQSSKDRIKQIQKHLNITADGIIGKNTINSILNKINSSNIIEKNDDVIENSYICSYEPSKNYSYGNMLKNTKDIQRSLANCGLYSGKIDGINGNNTANGLLEWKKRHEELVKKYGQLDKRSESNIWSLIPEFAEKVRQLMSKLGTNWKVICGLRTYGEQDELYSQGRTKPGNKVTNAKGGQSKHNFNVAADLCLFNGNTPIYNDSNYKIIGENINGLGIEWGGNWKSFKDYPHIQNI